MSGMEGHLSNQKVDDMKGTTRRERIVKLLKRRQEMKPTAIVMALRDVGIELTPDEALDDVVEIAESQEVMVAPPECMACGFDQFDNKANIPSQCPECKSLRIREPRFTIQE